MKEKEDHTAYRCVRVDTESKKKKEKKKGVTL